MHVKPCAYVRWRVRRYVQQLCSPTRASLLSSRYAYTIGMDGNVLTDGDARCIPANMSTLGDQVHRHGVKTVG